MPIAASRQLETFAKRSLHLDYTIRMRVRAEFWTRGGIVTSVIAEQRAA